MGVHDINKHWEDFKETALAGTPLSPWGDKVTSVAENKGRLPTHTPLSLSCLIWKSLDYLFTSNVLVTGSWSVLV